ncbi:ABC transporter ATP-binding protein [Hahella ganghwensis]|uniref:ABC transporter ATP-binding protein n=1 Tax=Hahella ganghwensis TaxID=286420 RepID=UPI000360364F|nr:ABC transporter ATP-binding protein [Hahella ganghwensis]
MAIVEVRQVSRFFLSGEARIKALDNVDLDIEKGEFTAMVGPSGSGKTTLLNQIGGLDHPDTGTITIEGRSITDLDRKSLTELRLWKIGFVFQEYNLIPVLSAQENVEYVMMLQRVSAKERQLRAKQALAEVGLASMEHRRPMELSGGQQQRVAVARAIVSRPAIVLADEPTANLDSKTGASLLDLMHQLNDQHRITFLFSTHDPMVMERANRVVHLKDGRIAREERKPAMGNLSVSVNSDAESGTA